MKAACEYRKQGYTFAEIAEAMGISTATAYRWVSEAIKEIPQEAAAEARSLILGRLDYFTSRAFEILVDVYDPGLVELVLKLDDRRARLLGLYQSNGVSSAVDRELSIERMKKLMELHRPILRIEAGTPIPANPIL
jgi:hypothetical protein